MDMWIQRQVSTSPTRNCRANGGYQRAQHMLEQDWSRGYRNISVRSDCIEAINLITRGRNSAHPFHDINDDAKAFVCNRPWQVIINHSIKDNICMANRLAKYSHMLYEPFCLFTHPPPTSSGVGGGLFPRVFMCLLILDLSNDISIIKKEIHQEGRSSSRNVAGSTRLNSFISNRISFQVRVKHRIPQINC